MRQVNRKEIPKTLKKNGANWKYKLLKEIHDAKVENRKPEDKYFNYYKKDEITNVLKQMYNSNCCYCECKITEVSYPHIEHRKPKKKYPESCYEWKNLHLGCEICNGHKTKNYNVKYPILDSVLDEIELHLTYEIDSKTGVWIKPISPRGRTTEKDADLNRDILRLEARQSVFNETVSAIMEMNKTNSQTEYDFGLNLLEEKYSLEHGSLIKYIVESLR